jgi:hypothetical protein
MSNDIVPFSLDSVPDYIRQEGQTELTKSLLKSGNSKRISVRGKKFRLVVGGEEIATRAEPHLDVVIVAVAKDYNRQYYANEYDPKAEAEPPTCWSPDGRKPHASVEAPLHANCNDCPKNVKGSGARNTKACRTKRRIAVALAGDVGGGVYMFELPGTSVFGTGDSTHMPFDQYANLVGSQGFSVDRVVTRARFDDEADQPKVCFSAIGFPAMLDIPKIKELSASPEAKNAITMTVYQADKEAKEAALPEPIAEPTARPSAKKETVSPKKDLEGVLSKFVNSSNTDDE